MSALLCNDTALDYEDPVRLQDGRESVRDDYARPALHHLLESILDRVLRDGVKS